MRVIHSKFQRGASPTTSTSSHFLTPPVDCEEDARWSLQVDTEAYETLISEGGIPSHPIEMGFRVLDPGEYQNIISFWKSKGSDYIFDAQLKEWRNFRGFRPKVRANYVAQDKFSEYLQKAHDRRRTHGLEGDVELRRDRDE